MSSNKVFINCPFDDAYFTLLKPLLFTLCYLGYKPQISETTDSGEVRLNKIKRLIEGSMFSVHDLSRMEPLTKGDLPRFNMPFECGVEFGMRLANPRDFKNKKLLILEKERYRYQKVISDISGNDIKSHNNEPLGLVRAVRDWFSAQTVGNPVPFAKEIWLAYNEFSDDFSQVIINEVGADPKRIDCMTFSDFIAFAEVWIEGYQSK